MILQALNEYYHRKREGDADALPAIGFERKEIPFVIVLDDHGRFVDLEDTRDGKGPHPRGRVFTVPQSEKRSGTKAWRRAFLLWDHPGFVLGHAEASEKAESARKQFGAFVERIERSFGPDPSDPGVASVLGFLRKGDFEAVLSHPNWERVRKTTSNNLSFRIAGERRLVCQRPVVRATVEREVAATESDGAQCLVTGEEGAIAVLHPLIKGVRGAKSSGANIVSFNEPAYWSFGRSKGQNAPVGERAAFAYTTALNHLLAKDSRQKAQVGDTTAVFWAEKETPLETLAGSLIAGGFEATDDPDADVEEVRAMYRAPWRGSPPLSGDQTRFYVLGLSPNASRIAIRFWEVTTVGQLAGRILQHFDDIEIVRPHRSRRFPALMELLRATAVQRKADNIPPNLAGATMQAVLSGSRYPRTLLGAAVRRNRQERDVTPDRAALIKACLVREARLTTPPTKEVDVSLDEANTNVGYRLGRLFAVLEKIQEEANPGINATIRDRFFGTASSVPASVFPRLLKLSNHHLSKLDNRGRAVNLERTIGTVVGGISDFPAVLELADQGRFGIGYYHQRRSFFTKSHDNNGETS